MSTDSQQCGRGPLMVLSVEDSLDKQLVGQNTTAHNQTRVTLSVGQDIFEVPLVTLEGSRTVDHVKHV
eukprot:m.485726 g.485726  ORF g.485726 m.485726 type:complete len:68 (+) comp75308_c0_seq1:317-520(+)